MRPVSRGRWWRCVAWKRAAAVVLPVWVGVGGAVGWHARTFARAPALEVVVAPPPVATADDGPPAAAGGGPLLWSQLAASAATGAAAAPATRPTHPFFPLPAPVWGAAVDAQVRAARREVELARLAGLPVREELTATAEPNAELGGPPPVIDGCRTFNTYVPWQTSPRVAFRTAEREGKLVFLMHLSGEIDDDGFT